MKKTFTINSRFWVDPSRYLLKDLETQKELRLEPRLIRLLCTLCEHRENLVTRDFLIKEIWNGYGGANEGLSQAISFLRKALLDEKKQIIETIPKNGYILHATVQESDMKTFRSKKISTIKYIFLLVPVCLAGLFFIIQQQNDSPSKDFKKDLKDAKVQMKIEGKNNKKAIKNKKAAATIKG